MTNIDFLLDVQNSFNDTEKSKTLRVILSLSSWIWIWIQNPDLKLSEMLDPDAYSNIPVKIPNPRLYLISGKNLTDF